MEKFTIKCLLIIIFLLASVLFSALLNNINLIILSIIATLIIWVIIVIKEINKFS